MKTQREKMIKVRVEHKNPVDNKTGTMYMKKKMIEWYRKNKGFSPFKSIRVLKK